MDDNLVAVLDRLSVTQQSLADISLGLGRGLDVLTRQCVTIESRLVESEKRSEVLAQEAATRHEVVLASKKQKQRSQIFKGRPLDRITDDDPKKLPHWFSRAEAKVKKMNEDIEDKELQYDILSCFDGNLSIWWSTQEDEFIGIKTWSQIKEHIFRHFGLWDL